MAWIETTEAGNVAEEQGLQTRVMTAAEDIKKGNCCTFATGEIADIDAAELGPFCIALEDIDDTEEGVVAIAPSVIYCLPGAAGFSLGEYLMPSEQTDEQGRLVVVSTPVFNEVVGVALETIADGATAGKVRLGYF